jgi:hypothetical protein
MTTDSGIVLFNTAVTAAAILIAYAFIGACGATLCALAGIPMMFAVSVSEFALCKKAEEAKERDAVLFGLQQIHSSIRYAGKSILSGMSDVLLAMGKGNGTNAYGLLARIRKRLLLGAQLDEAIRAECTGTGPACAALRDVGREYARGCEPYIAIENAYDRLGRTMRMDDARNSGRLQKYLTASMAIGTVMPSFAVFTFTGYSMVYYAHGTLALFGAVMLVIIPNVFALVRAHAAGLYEI